MWIWVQIRKDYYSKLINNELNTDGTSGVYHLMVSINFECGYGFRHENLSIYNKRFKSVAELESYKLSRLEDNVRTQSVYYFEFYKIANLSL